MTVIQALRSALFYLLFLGQTAVLAIVVGTIGILFGKTRIGWMLSQYWGNSNLWFLRWIIGMKTEVSGAENIPPGPCIFAAKHMSDWDIFATLPYTQGKPAFIAKKELMDIPFFGWAARTFDTIRIDRSKGGDAIPLMMADARGAIDKGCRLVIFPEGTRKAPLAPHDYRYGIVRMYLELGVPVVPVALTSGLYWSRNSLILWPGTSRAKFLPPIPPGLDGDTFRTRLIEAIEGETNAMILEDYRTGLGRPLPADFARRLRDLADGKPPEAAPAPQPTIS
jgi:1-acyl-sn-glycerol-3-phosphate acyltransferase